MSKLIKKRLLLIILWGILPLVLLNSCNDFKKSSVSFEKQQEFLGLYSTTNKPSPISDKEWQKVTALLDMPLIKTLPVEFQEFLQKFTESKEKQISLINKPLSVYSVNEENYAQKAIVNSEHLKKDWEFWELEDFFIGTQSIESNEGDIDVCCSFSGKDGMIVYTICDSESVLVALVFEKTAYSWTLTKFMDFVN